MVECAGAPAAELLGLALPPPAFERRAANELSAWLVDKARAELVGAG